MFQLEYPYLLLLTPLPLLGYRFLPPYRQEHSALRVTYTHELHSALPGSVEARASGRHHLWLFAYWVAWLLALVAAARPVELPSPIVVEEPTRSLVLAIDLSQSMDTSDYRQVDGSTTDRLSAVKAVVGDFIQRRQDDRIGLLVFGDRAFVQASPTTDHATVFRLLTETTTGMAGPSTAIGDAIGLTIRMLEEDIEGDNVLILLTDGNDTASRIQPLQAANIAARKNLRIYTVAVGDPDTGTEDAVDIKSLQAIATATGGQFFLASDREALASVYATLDELTPRQSTTLSFQPKIEWFWLPLALSSGLLLLVLAIEIIRDRRTGVVDLPKKEVAHGD
ncbi:VWA domain-containing protein [Marinobacter sp. chi1]|uniref:VWA domain-containing protein n=1 Tax=Marinobacter suaedae TaxID=3057675 RepID=A0ABT8W088_9GAMM|nr:VWA domain-containing protein [Marinobacter sp. chi1]MDO3721655.1 VWA domain-containing protein [Marinobacter sp. chi1]